ncbi:MAG: tetratricopeptide repeat protein [Bryobacteraceae bacterium]
MRRPRLLPLIACIAFLSPCAAAKDRWIKATSAHFEMLTTSGEKSARKTLQHFEQVRGFFGRYVKTARQSQTRVRIVVFQSEKEYAPYRINEYASAYYTGSRDRDFIVMRLDDVDSFPLAIHEYTHLVVKGAGLKLPAWLNEGIADLYSTLKPDGRKLQMGGLIPARMQVLLRSKWLPLEMLTAIDQRSPAYNEREKASIFYAQSWVLTHMLNLEENYRPRLSQFLGVIAMGASSREAFEQVYGRTLAQVQEDLVRYVKGGRFNAAIFDATLEKSADDPEIGAATAFETRLALADLLAAIRKPVEARKAYDELARENPESPEIELALARLSWQSRDYAGMRGHFARAIALGTTNPSVYFDYAMMLRDEDDKNPQIQTLLRKAVELDPGFSEGHYMLGFYAMRASDFERAAEYFRAVKNLDPRQAFDYHRAFAYASYRLGDRGEAGKHAAIARKYAAMPAEVKDAEDLMELLRSEAKQ